MTDLARILRREQRRHFAISFGLVSAAIVAGTMVTNERGVFSPILGGGALSALERAFAAIADGDGRTPFLFHRSASAGPGGADPFGDEPFDVLGAPADLRRRLMDALGGDNDPESAAQNQLPNIVTQDITPDQLAANDIPGSLPVNSDSDTIGPRAPTQTNGSNAPGPAQVQSQQQADDLPTPPVAPVPEPTMWALMITGFGLIGLLQRRSDAGRRRRAFLAGEDSLETE